MTTNPTRHRRLRLAGACAMTLALAAGAIALPAAPAHAADPITAADQSYFAYYHLDQARAKGYTDMGPTNEETQQYLAGLVDPRDVAGDPTYTYRGLDESILKDTDIPTPIHLGTSPRYHAK